ncbi:MAG: bifunctional precorrin-2 dehydrogenase/sirohydrochlorin ferrochelatase [Crocinitomicaceae bacterium]|nr:bifunctional precorrin-2 dehydrogenase/sirohydrochlorin ferrochelatase [Crocinitomicaceae bacterium]
MSERNNLYPIFLKAKQLDVLIIGAGKVGAEKLHFLLKSSPDANVEVVAIDFNEACRELAKRHNIKLTQAEFSTVHLNGRSLVIAATNDKELNRRIYCECRENRTLVNVADNPELCDFYLGGIVTKGDLKIAISTNGKSPVMAKRIRQYFEDGLPDNIDELLINMNTYRKRLRGDFQSKVNKLNELTQNLIKN